MIFSIEKSKEIIGNNPKPLMLIDTCSFLDLLRIPIRDDIPLSHLHGAVELLKQKRDDKLFLLSTVTVKDEINTHIENTELVLKRHIGKVSRMNLELIDAVESLKISFNFSIKGLETTKLTEGLKKVITDLQDECFFLDGDDECKKLAFDRSVKGQAPASVGKAEPKDCFILEHFLALTKALRDDGFDENVVFITSNLKDFGSPLKPKEPINTEFCQLDIGYCNNFAWGLQSVGLATKKKM